MAEYLYIKKRDPNQPRTQWMKVYAWHEQDITDHVCYCPFDHVGEICYYSFV
jgi:hypothetical protein